MAPCGSRHRWIARGLLAVVASTVIVSGFAWALGHWEWSVWPWNRAWFMFSSNDGRHYALTFFGRLQDGRVVPVDMRRWFRVQPGCESLRSNYLPRSAGALRALAHYICRRSNEAPDAGSRMERITVVDLSWPQERGRRRRSAEVPLAEMAASMYLDDAPCPGEALR